MPGHPLSARIHQLGTSPLAFRRRLRLAPALLLAAACSGCAAFSPDGGMDVVTDIAAAELKVDANKINGEESNAAALARTRAGGRGAALGRDAASTVTRPASRRCHTEEAVKGVP